MEAFEHQRGEITVTTDRTSMDLDMVHKFLASSYWAAGIPRYIFLRSVENSLCFGVFENDRQVGFARVITDYATYAYLADVFILESHRGKGLSKFLMECIVAHPQLQGLRRWTLATRDAHGLYEKFGFTPLDSTDRFMERHSPDVYKRPSKQQ